MENDPADPWLSELGRMAFGPGPDGADPSGSRTIPADLWEPPSPEELQRLLPQYEITGFLGRGGMGAVYKGRQAGLDRDVAIKLLPEALVRDGDGMNHAARFEQEARAMARLDHSAIVPVHDFGRTERGQLYFVMQHIDGTDLHQHLKQRGGRLPQGEALAIVAQILDALDYAHGQGIVHRDIKPGNILLNRDGRVKIADFGLAKRFDDESADSDLVLTMSHVTVGTRDYVAPEALDRTRTPDHRADLYAVGVMLYQLLTGQLPRGAFEPPSGMLPGLDPRLDRVISKAMAANPDRRQASAAELKRELEALSGGDAAAAKPPGVAAPTTVRPALRVTAWLTAVLLVVAGLFLWLARDRMPGVSGRTGTPPDRAPDPDRATQEAPFVNRLGMKFVPVPGTGVLFCIHETRWRDYAVFAEENPGVNDDWRSQSVGGVGVDARPGDHPAWRVGWEDAKRFCEWLSKKEGFAYRLPTDEEWSLAAGLGGKEKRLPGDTPESLSLKLRDYPWGMAWPPPAGSGNYGDRTYKDRAPPGSNPTFVEGYDDGFPTTAPVMSFASNELGLHDMGGNVWEWVEDWFNAKREVRVRRGGSWADFAEYMIRSSYRYGGPPSMPHSGAGNGFRVVLDPVPAKSLSPAVMEARRRRPKPPI